MNNEYHFFSQKTKVESGRGTVVLYRFELIKSIYILCIYIVKGMFCTFLRFILRLSYGYGTVILRQGYVDGSYRVEPDPDLLSVSIFQDKTFLIFL